MKASISNDYVDSHVDKILEKKLESHKSKKARYIFYSQRSSKLRVFARDQKCFLIIINSDFLSSMQIKNNDRRRWKKSWIIHFFKRSFSLSATSSDRHAPALQAI